MNYTILQGDNRETLKTLEDASVDAIVTDPPYGIDFLGKDWDANTGALETYRECFRVLKPGGHILAFSAARTYHHLAITLERAGFDIRDQIMWLYSSGFPKAQDIGKSIQRRQGVEETQPAQTHLGEGRKKQDKYGNNNPKALGFTGVDVIPTSPEAKQWAGWKTALKPSHEPIAMARKPFKGSTIDNVLEHGVGALNIDATRIPLEDNVRTSTTPNHIQKNSFETINTDEQKTFNWSGDPVGFVPNEQGRFSCNVIGEVEGYQKFFYCPKVSRKERHIGFENPMNKPDMLNELGGYFCDKDGNPTTDSNMCYVPGPGKIYVHGLRHEYEKIMGKQDPLAHIPTSKGGMYAVNEDGSWTGKSYQAEEHIARTQANNGNNHPTVKPVALMRYLIKLVTPPNAIVLDPFCGSGSTGMAAIELGHTFIGCELDPAYVDIAKRRIEAWNTEEYNNNFKELFE